MKVVLFCGGLGLRLREYSDNVPKPMVPVGYRPIIWHLMKYYAHYGHRDFILCLGYRADVIKDYFLNYSETVTNDFVLSQGGRNVKLLSSDIDNWNITFVETGIDANVGERLLKVKQHIGKDEWFLANYSDNVCNVPLPTLIDHAQQQNKIASFLTVRPSQSFHVVLTEQGDASKVTGLTPCRSHDIWMNGGFFVLKNQIFDYINPGEELVVECFDRLIAKNQLTTYRHDGFFACMDTFKEKMVLDDLYAHGKAPWAVWKEQ
jgi:glucose-1-phosphate cytidylyltransferase